MGFENKRWRCLSAGVCINLLVGVMYAWSVFVLPLHEKYGWSMSQLAMAYTLASVTMMITNMFIIPILRKKLKLRTVLFAGAILYCGGIIISGLVTNLYLFYLSFSIMSGTGSTLLYPVLMGYSQMLYPEKPGFSSGIMAFGYGLCAVIWATVASKILTYTGDVSNTLVILGAIYLVGIVVASLFIEDVPEGFGQNLNVVGDGDKKKEVFLYEKSRKEMIRDPLFPMLYICLAVGSVCGNMIITQSSPIMQNIFEMTPEMAAMLVSLFALGNTLGRPVWGKVSDIVGRLPSFILLYVMLTVSMTMLFICRIEILFIGAIMVALLCYGGLAALLTPITLDFWGAKHITENYGVTFSIFGVSTIIGAPMIAAILEKTGGYNLAFAIGGVLSLIGLMLALILFIKVKAIRGRE
ncbi:MAG: OFA family MFS transporter [Firmicutes bacterium]|nr:OFA family MFS transporter [Bacillota bacterium]